MGCRYRQAPRARSRRSRRRARQSGCASSMPTRFYESPKGLTGNRDRLPTGPNAPRHRYEEEQMSILRDASGHTIVTLHHLDAKQSVECRAVRKFQRTLGILGKDTRVNCNDTLQDASERPDLMCRRRSKVLSSPKALSISMTKQCDSTGLT